jgi:hypothetical protein
MPPSTFIAGRPVERPLLASATERNVRVPGNFIYPFIFPLTWVPDLTFEAPVHADDTLEAVDDDTIGRDTRMLEQWLTEGSYNEELGMHGRMARIPHLDLMKAARAQQIALQRGATGSDVVFNLKLRLTTMMLARNDRHMELLASLLLLNTAKYSPTHVLGGVDGFDIENSLLVRELIMQANNIVVDDGDGNPITDVVIGEGARIALERNTNIINLLPEDAMKVLTPLQLQDYVSPAATTSADTTQQTKPRVIFANARVKDKATAESYPIIDNWIWVGRNLPDDNGTNQTFGRTWWTHDEESSTRQRVFINELRAGIQRNTEIGLTTYYKPGIPGAKFGVLIRTKPASEIT